MASQSGALLRALQLLELPAALRWGDDLQVMPPQRPQDLLEGAIGHCPALHCRAGRWMWVARVRECQDDSTVRRH